MLMAVSFATVGEVVPRLGLAPGQLLVDATNPFGADTGDNPIGAAVVVAAGSGVRVVKAFNVLGAERMSRPAYMTAIGRFSLLPQTARRRSGPSWSWPPPWGSTPSTSGVSTLRR